MPKTQSDPVRAGLPAANIRLGWHAMLLAMEAQQNFTNHVFTLWRDLTAVPESTAGSDGANGFGARSAEAILESAQRVLRYASGIATAAIESQAEFSAKLQQAITEWQSECPHNVKAFGMPDFAREFTKLMTPQPSGQTDAQR